MPRRQPVLVLMVAALITLALLTVFAIELSDTQAKSRRDVTARVHERAVLSAALIDSLFQTVGQQIPQNTRNYGAADVTTATMNRNRRENAYLALLDASSGRVLSSSRGFTSQAQTGLADSAALKLVRASRLYGLGDVRPYGRTGVIDLAVTFPTPHGQRILVTGFQPKQLSAFLFGELRKVPGVKGARNYLLDGRSAVIASTDPTTKVGRVFDPPGFTEALPSGDAGGYYYDQVKLSNSTWRVVLSAPEGPLYESVSGLRKWVPWLIFAAFALVAVAALMLGRRVLRAADQVREANAQLGLVNAELAGTNDVLARRAAELARSNGELEQFASIASHDLQEPLRKVRTFTEQVTAMDADNLSEKGRDYLVRANAAAARMQMLIDDLLKFSRVATQGRPFAPVDLGTVTHEVIDDLEAQIQRSDAEVRVGDLPTITGDALQLRQLMQNLLSNALKFHRDGIPPEVTIDTELAGDTAIITVRDNGIGFDPQYSRRIFRVFERLHGRSEYPGTGIGLALCRKIVERHGGTILADGVPGAGSTFTVTLPVNQRKEVIAAVHDSFGDEVARRQEESSVPV